MIEVYPATPSPAFALIADEAYNTIINRSDSGVAERNSIMRFPERQFELIYKNLFDSEIETVRSFFRRHRGAQKPFWYFYPRKPGYLWNDEFVGLGGLLPIFTAFADDGGVLTDETLQANNSTASDMILMPASPQVGDRYHFMMQNQIDTLRVNIGIPGVGTWTITWKYSKSDSSYAALSGVTDGTNSFKAAAGNHDVTFTIPSDWAIIEVGGINGYDLVAEVTAFTSMSTQPKGTQAWASSKIFDLPSKNTDSFGSELLINGEFETDPNVNWIPEFCTIASVAGGHSGNCLQITRTSSSYQRAYQDLSLIEGKIYKVSCWIKSGTSGNEAFAVEEAYLGTIIFSGITSSTWTYYEGILMAGINNRLNLVKKTSTAGTMLFDSCSIKEMLLIIYIDSVPTIFTFISGGGAGGADRIQFSSTPAQGSLITADFKGELRIKGYSDDGRRIPWQGPLTSDIEMFKIHEIKTSLFI